MQLVPTNNWKATDNADTLAQAAITAALESRWQEAVKINEKILSSEKNNVEALNRLARAYNCIGQHSKAEKTYKKVLETDPYNIIALKNLEKLSKYNGNGQNHNGNGITQLHDTGLNLSKVFLDEPGKTKLVSLLNLAPPSILASLNCGDKLVLNAKNHSIAVVSTGGTYLGAFPDDLAHRLLAFISGGNKYEAYVKSSSTKNLTIFIREIERSAKFGNQPSFQSKSSLFEDEARPR
jgi:tetratricopeptide (TPR) repeat protein